MNDYTPRLRDYQEQAISKMIWARQLDGNDLVSLPTGSGKSLVISELAKRLNEPILILVPSKELLEQDKEKLEHWTEVNIYSASMNEKTVGHITLATIQSAYKNPELFKQFKVVIIDECDLVNPKNLAGMYNKFFKGMGNPKIYGLTATPFRMDTFYKEPVGGWAARRYSFLEVVTTVKLLTRYKERFWSRMLYTAHTQDLIDEGYLCPLTYHRLNLLEQKEMKFNKSKSDFDLEDFEGKFSKYLNQIAINVADMDGSVLIFCASITQAQDLAQYIKGSVVVTGETPKKERAKFVQGFKTGQIRVVINVGVLLVGFDKPDLQNIVICRPTRSLRLHVQLLGRGMRRAPQKSTCNIFDLVGNISVLGTAESLKIAKVNEKWNVVTSTFPEGLHMVELYTHHLKLTDTD